jgi:hypothetical protein
MYFYMTGVNGINIRVCSPTLLHNLLCFHVCVGFLTDTLVESR